MDHPNLNDDLEEIPAGSHPVSSKTDFDRIRSSQGERTYSYRTRYRNKRDLPQHLAEAKVTKDPTRSPFLYNMPVHANASRHNAT